MPLARYIFIAVFTLLLGLAACSPKTVSGTYVYASEYEILALNLVSMESGSLSGSLLSVTADNRHRISTNDLALNGSIDGDAITLSTPAQLFSERKMFSGTRSGEEIELFFTTRDGTSSITFRRSSPEEFARKTQQLSERVKQLADEKSRKDANAREQAAEKEMETYAAKLTADLERIKADYAERAPRLKAAIADFAMLTDRARKLARLREGELDSVQRGQLSVEIGQVQIDTSQLNLEFDQIRREFELNHSAVQRDLAGLIKWCERTEKPVCAKLRKAAEGYNAVASARASELKRAEAEYARAEEEQARL